MPTNTDAFRERLAMVIGRDSNRAFANRCGLSEGTIRRYLRGEAFPPLDTLETIAKVNNVDIGWLASGEKPEKALIASDPQVKYASAADLEHEYVMVPRYNVKVSLGGGSLVESEQVVDYLAFKSDWIRTKMHLNPADLILISAIGDSMYPTLRDGDLILLDKSKTTVSDDAIYVLRFDGNLIAKRLQKLFDGSVQIKSDNIIYDPQMVPADRVQDLAIIGRVMWIGGRV